MRRSRSDPEALGRVLVTASSGGQIPLNQVARVEHVRGPAMISSENGLLIATVLMNVQGRDVGGFVEEARQTVARDVSLPAGYYLGWSGRWENQEHARQRLQVVLPIVLVIIFVLLYFTYHSVLEAAHVLLAVRLRSPEACHLLLAAWLQLLRRGVGGLHRPLRDRGPDRRRHGHLSRGSGRPKA
jgi:Cu(I)/Ag(I) efflux system membrane protein CusA/SilA